MPQEIIVDREENICIHRIILKDNPSKFSSLLLKNEATQVNMHMIKIEKYGMNRRMKVVGNQK